MAGINTQITALDYNTLRNKIIEVIGTGAGSYGYGQSVKSQSVLQGQTVLKSQWDGLRYDIVNIKVHQNGVFPTIVEAGTVTGGVVRYSAADAYVNYNTLIDAARQNRFTLATGQYILSSKGSETYTSSWSTNASMTVTVDFATSEQARFFFNSGGKVRLSSTRTGGTSSQQNNAWTNLLSTVGEQDFGASTTQDVHYFTLTNNYQTYYQETATTPYSANAFRLEAKCDVANNATGTAKQVTIRVTWDDSYQDEGPPAPGDLVDGTLTLYVQEILASGYLQPTGTFTVAPPTSYSLSSITAT